MKKINLSFIPFLGILLVLIPCLIVIVSTPITSPAFGFNAKCESGDRYDIDGDHIPDSIEDSGVDVNEDGIIDLDLTQLEKKPNSTHKDLFLEIDYMKYHIPIETDIPNVISAFGKAPMCNPDGNPGITLHVQLGEEIPELKSINLIENDTRTWHGFNDLKKNYSGTVEERINKNDSQNIIKAKELIYHYAIFAHFYDNSANTGISNSLTGKGGMDFIVSLGNGGLNPEFNPPHKTGKASDQEGTLMHELGHNLGLGHGGGDDVHCKPNYVSVMNYVRQMDWFDEKRNLSYSSTILNTLNESKLNEASGLYPLINTSIFYAPNSENPQAPPISHIDWNRNNGIDSENISANINYMPDVSKKCA